MYFLYTDRHVHCATEGQKLVQKSELGTLFSSFHLKAQTIHVNIPTVLQY